MRRRIVLLVCFALLAAPSLVLAQETQAAADEQARAGRAGGSELPRNRGPGGLHHGRGDQAGDRAGEEAPAAAMDQAGKGGAARGSP